MTQQQSSRSLLSTYPKVFWVANVMELFERGAYYGMNSVLAVYLTNSVHEGGLGFSEQSVGFLQSLVYAITYVVPILGGALADRLGRKGVIVFSLITTAISTLIMGFIDSLQAFYVLAVLVGLLADVGGPAYQAAVADVLPEEQRAGLGRQPDVNGVLLDQPRILAEFTPAGNP